MNPDSLGAEVADQMARTGQCVGCWGRPTLATVRAHWGAGVWVGALLVALAGVLPVIEAGPASAVAGDLDGSYGDQGRALPAWAADWTEAEGAALQPDGRLVVVGRHGLPAADSTEWALARLTADGKPDPSFGDGDGFVGTDFAWAFRGRNARASAVAVQGDGKLVVVGAATVSGRSEGYAARYLPDGTLDASFGSEGIRDLGAGQAPAAVVVGPDGRIVVAGSGPSGSGAVAFEARFTGLTATGELDESFGNAGVASYDLTPGDDDSLPEALLRRADGTFVVVGSVWEGQVRRFLLARIGSTGDLLGTTVTAVGDGGQSTAHALAVGPDGILVAAGQAWNQVSGATDVALVRYLADGTVDDSFGDRGIVTTAVGGPGSAAYGADVSDTGEVLVGAEDASGALAAVRYTPGGALDEGFGTRGIATAPLESRASAAALVVDSKTDRAIVAGTVGDQIGAVAYRGAFGTEAPPAVASAEDRTVVEGSGGSTNASVTIHLDRPAPGPVAVHWATADGTATAPQDYAASTGDVTFAGGETTQTVTVPIVPDTLDEPDETLTVVLSAPSGARIGDDDANITIVDDDPPRTSVALGDAQAQEGADLSFPVTLSQAASSPVTIDLRTTDGTATSPGDYTATTTTLTIPAGATSVDFDVSTNRDQVAEPDETITVSITAVSGANTTAGRTEATGTIHDVDPDVTPTVLDIHPAQPVDEAAQLRFPVTLTRAAPTPTAVTVTAENGTAISPGDYTAKTETLTIPAGQTTAYFDVQTNEDQVAEGDETVKARITGGGGRLTTGTLSTTGTIRDLTGRRPVALKRMLTGPVSGTVRYRVPGSSNWVVLRHATPLPMGVVMDTIHGSVVLKFAVPTGRPVARDASTTRQVTVAAGQVQVRQRRDGRPLLAARGGSFSACSTGRRTTRIASGGPVDVVGGIADATLLHGRLTLTERCTKTVVSVVRGSARAWSHQRPGHVVRVRTGGSHSFRRG
jgi:uncharacterized delta-60 repeat protein